MTAAMVSENALSIFSVIPHAMPCAIEGADGSLLSVPDPARFQIRSTHRKKRELKVGPGDHQADPTLRTKKTALREPAPSSESVRAAAERGIAALAPTARRARRRRIDLDVLADELGGIFRQHSGVTVTRIVEPKIDETTAPVEHGRFKDFLALVVPPLEWVLAQYPNIPHRISRDSLVSKAIWLQRVRARVSPAAA
jgi:hypothetical protein